MKIDVLQIEDAKFIKWCFWSKWIDVAIYDYDATPFLLQMKVSRFNAKRFKSIRLTGRYAYRQALASDIGDLVQMSSDG